MLDICERNYQSALDRLACARTDIFEDQHTVAPLAQLRGVILRLLDDPARAHASFDTARAVLELEVRSRPDDYRLHSSLGIVYAGLGMAQEAVREAERAAEQLPVPRDAMSGAFPILTLAQVYTMVGMHDAALDKLEYLMSLHAPKVISAHNLRLDPVYDPLRSNQRFQALLAAPE